MPEIAIELTYEKILEAASNMSNLIGIFEMKSSLDYGSLKMVLMRKGAFLKNLKLSCVI